MNTAKFKELTLEQQINVINTLEVFEIKADFKYYRDEYTDEKTWREYYHEVKLVGVVSKSTFKQILEVRVYNKFFNKNSFEVNSNSFAELFEMSVKTQKYGAEKLQTILENRLNNVYKYKVQLGQTWNEGGIN